MNRRTFLAGAAGGLTFASGCATRGPAAEPGADPTTDDPSKTPARQASASTTGSSMEESPRPTSPGITGTPRPPPTIIPFDRLSPESREEVRIAIEKGRYGSCEEPPALFGELDRIAPDSSRRVIRYQGQRYRPVMMSGSDSNPDDNCEVPKYILRLEEVTRRNRRSNWRLDRTRSVGLLAGWRAASELPQSPAPGRAIAMSR
jgi:hypothetical protein